MGGDRWRADDGVVLRTPLLPTRTLLAWSAAPREQLAEILSLPEVDEAIFVASPSLHAAIATWREKPDSAAGQRAERALTKYVGRMASRCTPFGLFSGISPGALGRETAIELAPRSQYRRRTRIDNDYLFVLASELATVHRERLVVRPNSSLYRVAGRLRCAATRVVDKDRRYDLIAIDSTPYLEATLARAATGAKVGELAAALVDGEITLAEASEYIAELVRAQILVPELSIYVTGPEPIDGLIAQLRDVEANDEAALLDTARGSIAELDARGLSNTPDRYRAIATSLEPLPAKIDLAKLFQVDMVKPGSVVVDRRIATEVLRVVEKLAATMVPGDPMEEFKRAFSTRWEDQEIPLALALDEEAGIGFEASRAPGAEGAPLLAGLGIGAGAPGTTPFRQHHLLKRLADADRELVLTDADFDAMKSGATVKLPDAFATMISLASDGTFLFEGTSGPSGAKLHGRFCHASPEIEAMVRSHHAREEALRPSAAFAEIVHLNEGRIGNILCRPVLRGHEIAFLGTSGAPRDQQLSLNDLFVSIRDGRVVLRSKQLDREVIPRLTTAHNYRLRSLGVYRFLCALGEQGANNAGFGWGPLGGSRHLPRVRYGKAVLARETWNLDKDDCKLPLAELRERRKLPRFVVLADGDNELPIDLDNPLLAGALADELDGRAGATLHELWPPLDQAIAHGPEGNFAGELILTFARDGEIAKQVAPRTTTALKRSFVPGSEWLYAKIYCGEASGDRVLREVVAPVVRAHEGPWFFIRYQDPDTHIRVRLRGDPSKLLGESLPLLERSLAPLLDAGLARKLVLDTYDRELERYGGDAGMELIEELFWRDSECVLSIVELLEGDAGADARWRLAVRGIEGTLVALGLDQAQREKIYKDAKESLGREMAADTALWGRIGDRFTKERASLDLMFAPSDADADHDLEPGFTLLAQRDAHIREIAARMTGVDIPGLAWSIVHMHANRLLHASQRAQELVLYDFLRRLHASKRSRRG